MTTAGIKYMIKYEVEFFGKWSCQGRPASPVFVCMYNNKCLKDVVKCKRNEML